MKVENTTQKLTEEQESFIKTSSNQIADKYRHMFKDPAIVNSIEPEFKEFQASIYFTLLRHDSAKGLREHMKLVEDFLYVMNKLSKITPDQITPGIKLIEDLLEKYECRQMVSEFEKRIEELKPVEERNN